MLGSTSRILGRLTDSADETTNRRKILAANEPVTGGIDRGTLDEDAVDTSALTKTQIEDEKEKARAAKVKETLSKGQANTVKMNPDKKVLPNNKQPVAKAPATGGQGATATRDANNKPIKNGAAGVAKKPVVKKPVVATADEDENRPF